MIKPPQHQEESYYNHPAYIHFISSIKSNRTIDLYTHYLDKFYLSRHENRLLTLDQILSKSPKDIENEIIGILTEMRKTNYSYSSINLVITSLCHFFEINDVVINKKKINRFKGDNVSKFEYRSYTNDEINILLSVSDERTKAAVLLMASTGIRVGALPGLKLKHLRKWDIEGSSYHVYQITAYANSPKDRYFTFCTPEAAKSIDDYLDLRKRYGDILTPDSNLFINTFDKMTKTILNKKSVAAKSIAKIIVKCLIEIGIRTNKNDNTHDSAASYKHELHPCHSLRIFAVTNMQRSKVDKTIREMLVGHSTGLDKSYYKPQDEEILQEYLKAVDSLTINNENKLKKQIKELEGKNKDSEYIINGKLQEKDEQIKSLTDQFSSMKNMLEHLVKGLSETKDQQQVNSVTQSLFSSGVIKKLEF